MQITGEEFLANNSYASIIINDGKITVRGTSEIALNSNQEFVRDLKNATKDKQIDMLIEYFILHNSVGGMIYGCPMGGQGKNTVVSTDNKTLIINEEISKENSEKIIKKYLLDRNKCLENTTHKKVILSAKYYNSTMYEETFDTVEFSLAAKREHDIYESEITFIKKMLDTLFKDVEIGINSGFVKINGEERFDGYYIESKDSDVRVKLENIIQYNHILVPLIYNHNCDVRRNKKEENVYLSRQIKMEGF